MLSYPLPVSSSQSLLLWIPQHTSSRPDYISGHCRKPYDYLEGDLATIRAGRANPHVLDKLRVDYYGTPTPIQQVGNVTVPEPRIEYRFCKPLSIRFFHETLVIYLMNECLYPTNHITL